MSIEQILAEMPLTLRQHDADLTSKRSGREMYGYNLCAGRIEANAQLKIFSGRMKYPSGDCSDQLMDMNHGKNGPSGLSRIYGNFRGVT